MTAPSCPLCASARTETFTEVRAVPVHVGVLWPTADAARGCARGDVVLAFCGDCGFIWNVAFDPALLDYTQDYDNSLAGSATFRAFDSELAKHLVTRYGVHDTIVVEIGSGDGRFLSLLCEYGDNRGIGYEPSAAAGGAPRSADPAVTIVPRELGVGDGVPGCGLVACRQVLEHVADPHELPRLVAREFGAETIVYFEVPNALMALRDLSVWDLVYEHCAYFAEPSLRHLFELDGYDVIETSELFAGQFLGIEARPRAHTGACSTPDVAELAARIAGFGDHLAARRDRWASTLRTWRSAGESVAVWGAGARAVSFFAMLGITDEVSAVVDVNENKHGKYLAGSGRRVVAPDQLVAEAPDHVVIMNPLYEAEIRASLSALGVGADVVVA